MKSILRRSCDEATIVSQRILTHLLVLTLSVSIIPCQASSRLRQRSRLRAVFRLVDSSSPSLPCDNKSSRHRSVRLYLLKPDIFLIHSAEGVEETPAGILESRRYDGVRRQFPRVRQWVPGSSCPATLSYPRSTTFILVSCFTFYIALELGGDGL